MLDIDPVAEANKASEVALNNNFKNAFSR